MRGHQTTFISWNVNVGIVDWLQKVESGRVAFECVYTEQVACIDSVSQELKASGGGWNNIWSDCTNFRDAEYTVLCSSKRASEWVIGNVNIFE